MSNPTVLQSRNVPLAFSSDGLTYKTVVCKKSFDVNIDPSLTTEESDCGVHSAPGATRWSFGFEIIMNTTPNGSTELSANTIAGWANSGTLVYAKLISSGAYYRQGQGYITNYKESAPQSGFVTATGTFVGDNTLDISE
jgi:hypothetical protein